MTAPLVRYPDLKPLGIPFSKSHIYHLMQLEEFPRPIRLTANTVAWLREEVEDWINKKILAQRNNSKKINESNNQDIKG